MTLNPRCDFLDNLVEGLTALEALPELVADGTLAASLEQRLRDNPAATDLLVKGALSQAAARLQADEEAELRQWEAEFAAQGRTSEVERIRRQRDALRQREAVLVVHRPVGGDLRGRGPRRGGPSRSRAGSGAVSFDSG
jgi:hypothetical protein